MNSEKIRQMNIVQIILYHILPGVPILLLAAVFANPDWGFGMNVLLALLMGVMIGLVPVQLSIIMITAKRWGMKFKDMIPFTEKTPIGKFILFAAPCFILGVIPFVFFSGIEYSFWGSAFSFMPEWLRLDNFTYDGLGTGIFRVTALMNLIFNGFLGPITEEIYFRGFLLPRMDKLGKFAPLANAALFSLYHLFSPWEIVTRILGVTPLAYAAWYKKDIRISMVVHCSMNLVGCIGMMAAAFQ